MRNSRKKKNYTRRVFAKGPGDKTKPMKGKLLDTNRPHEMLFW